MSSKFDAIKAELDTDPLTRGYSGMTDEQAAADLNTEYRSRIKPTLSGIELRGAFDETEFAALTDGEKQMALAWASADEYDSSTDGADDRILKSIFGAGSTTRSNLATARQETVSRAVELGFGPVKVGDVQYARSLP